MLRNLVASILVVTCLVARGSGAAEEKKHEPILDGCESCEWAFEGTPDSMSWSSRIAPAGEKGEPMRIDGVVRDQKGHPVANVIVYAYHTDPTGHYPRDPAHPGVRHGRLRGWTRTGADGRYHFDTIRPAGYPDTDIPQHVHMQVIEVGRCEYTIDSILFEDDPRLTKAKRAQEETGRGGSGIVHPTRDTNGTWQVTRDIVLGQNIANYPK